MEKKPPKVENPLGMLCMTVIVIGLVGYLYWDTLRLYLNGGPEAPSLATVILGGLLLLAGAGYVASAAIRIFIRAKKEQKEEQKEQTSEE